MAKAVKPATKAPVKRAPRKKPIAEQAREEVLQVQKEVAPAKPPFYASLLKPFAALSLPYKICGAVALLIVLVLIFRGCSDPVKQNEKAIQQAEKELKRLQAQYDSLLLQQRVKDSLSIVSLAVAEEAHRQTMDAMEQRNITMEEGQKIRETIKRKTDETNTKISNAHSVAALDSILDGLLFARRLKQGAKD